MVVQLQIICVDCMPWVVVRLIPARPSHIHMPLKVDRRSVLTTTGAREACDVVVATATWRIPIREVDIGLTAIPVHVAVGSHY